MDWLLRASSDPFWVFTVFFGMLFLFHYLFVFKNPLNIKQWKLVEFIWVGLALVSVFGIIEQARFFNAKLEVEQSNTQAMHKIMALENWFTVYSEFACEDNANNADYRQLCIWTKVKKSDLRLILDNEEFPVDLSQNFLSGIDKLMIGLGKPDQAIVSAHHEGYLTARKQYLIAQENGKRSVFSMWLVALAPMLFAGAVAIKFTKVTGEYRLYP